MKAPTLRVLWMVNPRAEPLKGFWEHQDFYVHEKSVQLLVWQHERVEKNKAKCHHLSSGLPMSWVPMKVTVIEEYWMIHSFITPLIKHLLSIKNCVRQILIRSSPYLHSNMEWYLWEIYIKRREEDIGTMQLLCPSLPRIYLMNKHQWE